MGALSQWRTCGPDNFLIENGVNGRWFPGPGARVCQPNSDKILLRMARRIVLLQIFTPQSLIFPQRQLMGSSAEKDPFWCRRRVRFNKVPGKVPEKVLEVWEALKPGQVQRCPREVWEGFGAEPGQIQHS